MANTIRETYTVTLSGTQFSASMTASSTTAQVGTDYTAETQTVLEASWDALDIGFDLSTLKVLMVRNTDDTNYVELALDNAGVNKIAKINPLTTLPIPVNGATSIYAKAHTADCKVEFLAIAA